MDLEGTTALVTGGADGIGAGIAERLAAEGIASSVGLGTISHSAPRAAGRQTSSQRGLDDAAEGDELLLAAGRPDELEGGGQASGAAGNGQR